MKLKESAVEDNEQYWRRHYYEALRVLRALAFASEAVIDSAYLDSSHSTAIIKLGIKSNQIRGLTAALDRAWVTGRPYLTEKSEREYDKRESLALSSRKAVK